MANEDGQTRVFTSVWGKQNAEPRAVHAVNLGAAVSGSLVDHELQGELAGLEKGLERVGPSVPLAEYKTLAAITEVAEAETDKDTIVSACRVAGIGLPDHRWARSLGEASVLGGLVGGDILFTSITFEVFGLSDKRVGFLPFSDLQIAALSTVLAMLLLAWFAGKHLRLVGHLVEPTEPTQPTEPMEPAEPVEPADPAGGGGVVRRGNRVRRWFTTAAGLVAVVGAFGVLVGLSEVRASYLAQSGVNAHASQFLLIQAGIAAAGVVLAWWMAHPFDREWRSAQRHLTTANRRLTRTHGVYAGLVGEFNGLLRYRDAVVNQYCSWALATVADGARKGQMYGRRVLLAQPEPTTDGLLPAKLPVPATPELVVEVAKYRAGTPSVFKRYEPLTTATVDARLAELARTRAGHNIPPAANQPRPGGQPPVMPSAKRGRKK